MMVAIADGGAATVSGAASRSSGSSTIHGNPQIHQVGEDGGHQTHLLVLRRAVHLAELLGQLNVLSFHVFLHFLFLFLHFVAAFYLFILASLMFFPSAASADHAWNGEQLAKANARLERMTRFVIVCFLIF